MPNVGRLHIDASLLARLLNFPPDHNIVSMGWDPQQGGFLVIGGPTIPGSDGINIPTVTLNANFFGSFQAMPTAPGPAEQQVAPAPPFMV